MMAKRTGGVASRDREDVHEGCTVMQMLVLKVIQRHGNCALRTIVRELNWNTQGVRKALAALMRKGYVIRVRRGCYCLTELGEKYLERR